MLQWGTTDQVGSHGVKILVYGGSGAGKTKLIETLPRPAIASAESGLLVLRGRKIPFAQIRTIQDLLEFYAWACTPQARQYCDSIAIDSVSEIAEVVLRNELRLAKDPRQAYGELIVKVIDIVRMFRDLPGWNLYVSAKMEFTKNEAGQMFFMPAMPGQKLGPGLPYYFDEVFYLGKMEYEGKSYRFLQTELSGQYVAKDRSGRLAPMEYPDLGQVITKILS